MRATFRLAELGEPTIDFTTERVLNRELEPIAMTPEDVRYSREALAELPEEALKQMGVAAEIITRQAILELGPEMGLDYRKGLVAEYVRAQAMAKTVESPVRHGALYFSAYNTDLSRGKIGYSPDAITWRQQQYANTQRTHSGRTFHRGDERFARLYPR